VAEQGDAWLIREFVGRGGDGWLIMEMVGRTRRWVAKQGDGWLSEQGDTSTRLSKVMEG
jgi:hypothetical protein